MIWLSTAVIGHRPKRVDGESRSALPFFPVNDDHGRVECERSHWYVNEFHCGLGHFSCDSVRAPGLLRVRYPDTKPQTLRAFGKAGIYKPILLGVFAETVRNFVL